MLNTEEEDGGGMAGPERWREKSLMNKGFVGRYLKLAWA